MKIRAITLFFRFSLVLALLAINASTPAQAAVQRPGQYYTPYELDFGPVGVGSSAPQMIVTITNSGTTPLTGWAGGAVPAPFNASQDCNIAGGVLPGHSCHYYFNFNPTAVGTFTATSNSSTIAGPISITVHGTGVGPSLSYDAHTVDMGNVWTNGTTPGTAAQQVVTIHNTGMVPLTGWAGGAISSPFNASQDCNIAGGVLPGHSCHYFINFSTTTVGTFTATSNSSSDSLPISIVVDGRSHSNILVGGGQVITPLSIDFGPVGVGKTAQMEVAISNNGIFSNITGWAGGAVAAPFNGSQDCNISGGLPVGSTCHYYFTFSPTAAGTFSADSNSSDSYGSFSIHMTGTGVAPSMKIDALGIDFGLLSPYSAPVQEIVTITNTGLSNITGWAGGAVAAPFNGSQDCNVAGGLAPGASCHFFYTFSPTKGGIYNATSNFSTNAGNFHVNMRGSAFYESLMPFVKK